MRDREEGPEEKGVLPARIAMRGARARCFASVWPQTQVCGVCRFADAGLLGVSPLTMLALELMHAPSQVEADGLRAKPLQL